MTGFAMSFGAMLLFAFALFALADIRPSATPLVSLATITTITVLMALIHQLRRGVYTSYALCVLAFVYAVIKNKDSIGEKAMQFMTAGNLCFVAASLFMLVVLSGRQPLMYQWDEFSFWGTAAKLVKNHDAIYTFYKSSMLGNSIPPAMAVLSYIFQWTAPQFSEWMCFLAYDVMFFAVFAAVTSVFDGKKPYLAPLTFVLCTLLPYFFDVTTRTGHLQAMYVTVYSDIPLALLFTGIVAVYFSSRHTDSRTVLPVLPVIAMLTFAKDMGFALSCIALFIIFFDLVVSKKEYSFFKIKGLAGKISAAVLMFATTVGGFVLWSVHLGRVLSVDRTDFTGSSESMGMARMMINGVKQLLMPSQRSEKFSIVLGNMISAFFNTKVCMIGSGLVIVGLITGVFAVAFITGDKGHKIRTAVMYITGWIGFVGYYVFHIFLYVFIFRNEAYTLASYNRYMYTYYIGWLVFALMCLGVSATQKARSLAAPALAVLAVAVARCCCRYLQPENTFLMAGSSNYTVRQQAEEKLDFLGDAIKEDDVLFVYNSTDSGYTWFAYTFLLCDHGVTQEPYIEVDWQLPLEEQAVIYQKELADFMQKKGVTKFIMDFSDTDFDWKYSTCFDVHPGNFGLGAVGLYDVEYTEDGFACHLIKGTGF